MMRRYFIEVNHLNLNSEFNIEGELFHHIFDVCRLQIGAHFELLTLSGDAYLCEALEISKKRGVVFVKERRPLPRPQPPWIHLLLSFPKTSTFESIVEKSVEMGVKSIHPIISDYSFVKSLSGFPLEKEKRWHKIITQATQQSARGDQMQILPPQLLSQLLQNPPWNQGADSLGVFAFEGDCSTTLKSYLHHWRLKHNNLVSPQNIYLFVGSEGGFSQKEVTQFSQLDLQPVTLGAQVLRVETACMTLISALKYEFGGNDYESRSP